MDDAVEPRPRETGAAEWTRLFLEKTAPNTRKLIDIDSELAAFLGGSTIPWYELLDFLKDLYHDQARELHDESSQNTVTKSTIGNSVKRHLVLFNPENDDYLIRLTLSLGMVSVVSDERETLHGALEAELAKSSTPRLVLDAFTVSREGYWTEAEYIHVDSVVQSIAIWAAEKANLAKCLFWHDSKSN